MSQVEFKYTAPRTVAKFMQSDHFHRVLTGPIGCLPHSAEFLTPVGWVPISSYTPDLLVAQWHQTGHIDFVTPEEYHKYPCDSFIRFRTKSTTMSVSDEHRMPLYDWGGRFVVKSAADVAAKPSRHIVPTTFIPGWAGSEISDEDLRLAVAINADGNLGKTPGQATTICVRKERKKTRIRQLLSACGVVWKEFVYTPRVTETTFSFHHWYKAKTYSSPLWWGLSQRQLQIVLDEMSHWDGLFEGPDTRFHTANKGCADFIQYAVHACGGRATVSVTTYPDKPTWRPTYIVHIAPAGSLKSVVTLRGDVMQIDRVQAEDGMKYCFTVPTGFFLCRQDGSIFVTGNSGKSVGSCVEVLRRNLEMPPWNHGVRSSKWAIVRNTMKELRNTTLETWMKWMKDLGEWQESKFTFHLKFGEVDSKILFLPLDGPGDIGRLLSLELTGMFTNECREFPAAMLADTKGRLGRYPAMQDLPATLDVQKWYPAPVEGKDPLWYWTGLIGDTNPPEIDSDWYHILEGLPLVAGDENSLVDVEVYHQPSGLSPEAENLENLRPGYYDQLAKGQPKHWVDTYIHGKYSPCQAGRPVYLDTFLHEQHISSVPLSVDPRLPVVIGFDCGLTPAAVFKQQGYDGRVRVLREAVAFDMGMKRFAETMLRPIVNNLFPENQLIFIGDPAGSRRADSDESSAFQMLKVVFSERRPVVKAAISNDPTVRIQATEQALCQFPKGLPMMVIDPSCKWYIDGLRSKYRRAKIKVSGEYAPTPEKNDWSHVVEAGQYADLFLFGGRFHPQDYLSTQHPHPFMSQPAYRPAQAEGY